MGHPQIDASIVESLQCDAVPMFPELSSGALERLLQNIKRLETRPRPLYMEPDWKPRLVVHGTRTNGATFKTMLKDGLKHSENAASNIYGFGVYHASHTGFIKHQKTANATLGWVTQHYSLNKEDRKHRFVISLVFDYWTPTSMLELPEENRVPNVVTGNSGYDYVILNPETTLPLLYFEFSQTQWKSFGDSENKWQPAEVPVYRGESPFKGAEK